MWHLQLDDTHSNSNVTNSSETNLVFYFMTVVVVVVVVVFTSLLKAGLQKCLYYNCLKISEVTSQKLFRL